MKRRPRLRRFGGAAVLAALGLTVACAEGVAASTTGDLGFRCFDNGTCHGALVCVERVCTELEGGAGAGGAAGAAGAAGSAATGGGGAAAGGTGGSATGGTGTGGASGTGGGPGGTGGGATGGTGGTGGSGTGGSGAGCSAPDHACAGVCQPNTPASGCTQSADCAPCTAPANGYATCTGGGLCSFACNSGFSPSGSECVGTGTGGTGGTGGGTGGTGGGTTGCTGGCPPPPTALTGCASCACDSPWTLSWQPSAGAEYYVVTYTCLIFPTSKNVGDVTSVDLCEITGLGACYNNYCANGFGAVTISACNAAGCSTPVNFTSGLPIACGGGVCC